MRRAVIQKLLPGDIETESQRWYAGLRFYGNDPEHSLNADSVIFLQTCLFLICSLFFIAVFLIFKQQKNPGNLAVPGYLTFGHNVPFGTLFI